MEICKSKSKGDYKYIEILEESIVIKYPKSEINGLWEERVGGCE